MKDNIIADRWRGKVATTKQRASIAALAWAAERVGQSYGVFTLNLDPATEERIQEDFEAYKRDRDAELAQRAQRVDNIPTTGGFIINDNDN